MKKYIYLLLGFGLLPLFSFSQDTLLFKSIPEIIFVEDKTEDERVFSPSQIEKIDSKKINYSAPSTSAMEIANASLLDEGTSTTTNISIHTCSKNT